MHNNLVDYMDYKMLEDIEIEGEVSTYQQTSFTFTMDKVNDDKESDSEQSRETFRTLANRNNRELVIEDDDKSCQTSKEYVQIDDANMDFENSQGNMSIVLRGLIPTASPWR